MRQSYRPSSAFYPNHPDRLKGHDVSIISFNDAADRRGYWITVPEILEDLQIHRRTWQRWRALGVAPECTRLPNGTLRVKRHDYDAWLENLAESEGTTGL